MANYITGLAGGGSGYFVDQTGTPRLFWADEPWGLCGGAGHWNSGDWAADFDAYLTARAAQGFTVITVDPYGNSQHGGQDSGTTWDGVAPFTTPYSVFNESFWTRIDYLISKAATLGITISLDVCYTSDFDATKVLNPMTGAQATDYGITLGNRYKNTPNLMWFFGDDYSQTSDTQFTNTIDGIQSTGDTHAVSIEYYPSGTTSRTDLSGSPTGATFNWGPVYATFNYVYYYWVTYFAIEQAYKENNQIPIVWGDGYFWGGEGGTEVASTSNRTMRNEVWWALASGARGCSMGSHFVWNWPSGAQAAVTGEAWYANSCASVRAVVESLTGWYKLIPDSGNALVTAGRGTRSAYNSGTWNSDQPDSYVAASLVPDGSLALLYLPAATTITIDQTKMAAGYTAKWIDPLTGATSVAAPGATYNSAAKGANSGGDADWALALLAPPFATWAVP